jgi:hypothetical protein
MHSSISATSSERHPFNPQFRLFWLSIVRRLRAVGRRIRTVGPAETKAGIRLFTFHHEELVGRGIQPPKLAFAISELPHVRVAVGEKGLEASFSWASLAIDTASDVVGADQHGAMGVDQSSVQLLGSSKFDHLPMSIEYSN